jgi:hypothetical protein
MRESMEHGFQNIKRGQQGYIFSGIETLKILINQMSISNG